MSFMVRLGSRLALWFAAWALSPQAQAVEPNEPFTDYPREIALSPGGELIVLLWRGSLALGRGHGEKLGLEVMRERSEDAGCQSLEVVPREGGGTSILTRPRGEESCLERVHLKLAVPDGARLRATISDGPIQSDSVSGEVDLTAVSGDVQVHGGQGRLRVRASRGGISVDRGRAEMELESVAGRIEVRGELGAPLSARSVSGGIHLLLPRLAATEINAETLTGDIQVGYPQGPRPSIEIVPGTGGLEADFNLPEAVAGQGEERWVRAVEEGRPLLRLRTRRGRIRLEVLDQEGDFEALREAPTASE